jgi:hypothetical protein
VFIIYARGAAIAAAINNIIINVRAISMTALIDCEPKTFLTPTSLSLV